LKSRRTVMSNAHNTKNASLAQDSAIPAMTRKVSMPPNVKPPAKAK